MELEHTEIVEEARTLLPPLTAKNSTSIPMNQASMSLRQHPAPQCGMNTST